MTDKVARARRAKALLESEDFRAAIADVQEDIWQMWRNTSHDEAARREAQHTELRALDRVVGKIQSWADVLIELASRQK